MIPDEDGKRSACPTRFAWREPKSVGQALRLLPPFSERVPFLRLVFYIPSCQHQRINYNSEILSREIVTRHPKRKMAWASVAPHPGPYPDGDVARRVHLRFAFATPDWWQ